MTAAEYDRVPQVVGADYESPVARSLERIWATKPGLLGWISTVDHKEIGRQRRSSRQWMVGRGDAHRH